MAHAKNLLSAVRRWLAELEAKSPALSDFARRFAGRDAPDAIVVHSSLLTWGIGAAMAAFVLIWAALSDFSVHQPRLAVLVLLSGVVASGAWWVRRRLQLQVQPMLVEAYAQISCISCVAVLASYEIGSLAVPYRDGVLAAIDQGLGFDWVAVTYLAARWDWVCTALRFAYQSFVWQPLAIIAMLSLSGAHRRLQHFMLAWVIGLAIALAGLAVAPAQTAWVHFGAHASLPDLAAQVGKAQSETLELLRSGGLRHLLGHPFEGIVAFPSFHTIGAILYVWALWPLHWLRWPTALLNGVMIVAAPVIGAHYLVDIIAGAVTASAALVASQGLTYVLSLPVPMAQDARTNLGAAAGHTSGVVVSARG